VSSVVVYGALATPAPIGMASIWNSTPVTATSPDAVALRVSMPLSPLAWSAGAARATDGAVVSTAGGVAATTALSPPPPQPTRSAAQATGSARRADVQMLTRRIR